MDTIRFIIPSNNKLFFAHRIGKFLSSVQYLNSYKKIEKEYSKFKLVDEFSGSYKINPEYKIVSAGLLFEFSIPKFLWGTNYNTCWREDFLIALHKFQSLLESIYKEEKLNFWKWILRRVDITYSFKFSKEEVQTYLEYFSEVLIRNKKPSIWKKKRIFEEVFWKRTSDSLKFYNKYAEILNHLDYHVISEEEIEYTKDILRFEHTWRSKYIQSFLKLPNESGITIEQFDYSMIENYNFNSHLQSLFKDFFRYEKVESLSDFIDEVDKKNFGKRYKVFLKVINEVCIYGFEFTKRQDRKSTRLNSSH